MTKNQKAKAKIVAEIAEKIKKAKSVVFVDYRGISVAHVNQLRKTMRAAGMEYKVYKNNLVARALTDCGIKGLNDKLENTLAVAFSYNDETSNAKALADIMLKSKKMEFKFGVLNGNAIDALEVKELATLTSKEAVISKLLYLLQYPLTKLAVGLSEIAKKNA